MFLIRVDNESVGKIAFYLVNASQQPSKAFEWFFLNDFFHLICFLFGIVWLKDVRVCVCVFATRTKTEYIVANVDNGSSMHWQVVIVYGGSLWLLFCSGNWNSNTLDVKIRKAKHVKHGWEKNERKKDMERQSYKMVTKI